jgi:putative ABC transport system substrate-binding protein
LVQHRPAVIAANYLPAALAAKAATQTIPIVFLSGSDPIGAGLVSSINRPTGNVTGIAAMFTLLGTKNLELLHDLVPKVTVIGGLANLTNPNAEHQVNDLQAAAHAFGQEVVVLPGSNEREIDSSFDTIAQRVGSEHWSLPVMAFLPVVRIKSLRWRPAMRCPRCTRQVSTLRRVD